MNSLTHILAPTAERLLRTTRRPLLVVKHKAHERYRAQARQFAQLRLQEAAAAAGLRPGQWQPCLIMQDPTLAIVEQEQEADCDLIVIGKHGAGVVEDFLLGSVTKHVLAESADAVLKKTVRFFG